MFKPPLSKIVTEIRRVAVALPSNPVHVTIEKTCKFQVNIVQIVTSRKFEENLTLKDELKREVNHNLASELIDAEEYISVLPQLQYHLPGESWILSASSLQHQPHDDLPLQPKSRPLITSTSQIAELQAPLLQHSRPEGSANKGQHK